LTKLQPIDEPWRLAASTSATPTVPPDILARLRSEPDIVEELSDRLRTRLNIESGVDFASFAVKQDVKLHVGVIVTVRYVPKCVQNDVQRLGHDRIASALSSDAIVVIDARGCEASVLGGVGAATIRAAGARVAIVDGYVRDLPEIAAAQLAVVARYAGIRSGRPTAQVVEIGGQVTLMQQMVSSGDVGIVNASGIVAIPAWLDWDEVRRILTD
jgi:regulator of RNase E activity RraA